MEKDTRSRIRGVTQIIKLILKILYQILVIFCILLICIIVLQRFTDSNKSIAGFRIFRVITGSMEPEYSIGEVVISKEVDPEDIKVGDDIVYKGTYGEYNGKIIMHSVVEIDRDENNELNFHAKGLHSASVEDPEISADQIYGVVKLKSDLLTHIYNLATSRHTAFIIIIILVLNIFITFKSTGKKPSQKMSEKYGSEDDEEIDEDVDEEYEDDEQDFDEDVSENNEDEEIEEEEIDEEYDEDIENSEDDDIAEDEDDNEDS